MASGEGERQRAGGRGSVVAITGVGSAVGQAIVARLDADPAVTRIVGVDRRPPSVPPAKLESVRADLRDPLLARVFAGVDILVHWGVPDDVERSAAQPFATALHVTRKVLDAAHAARVSTIVYLSSALVYGAHETNSVPLTEHASLRAGPEYPAAYQALVTEESVTSFASAHPECRVVILRPVPVLGQGVDSWVSRHLESPLLPMVRGFDPPVQFVDVDDLAAAVHVVARDERARGIYNVAADGWLTTSDVRLLLARPTVHLPQETAAALVHVLHRCRVLTVPPGALDYLMHPWVVDTARLHSLGWNPVWGQRDILHRFVNEHGPWLSVGRIRVRTARLISGLLVGTVMAALGAAWFMWRRWLVGWWRRRRARAPAPTRRRPDRSSAPGSS
jgi:nucleoside-diphosphate-sugar epimerase